MSSTHHRDAHTAQAGEPAGTPARQPADVNERGTDPQATQPPAVVINPTKVSDLGSLRALVEDVAADAGLPAPRFYLTEEDDPGQKVTRRALDDGASVVVAAGGDGTVRAVGHALAGSGVPLGLLPMGTGNLLARNFEMPRSSVRDLAITALTGKERPLDMGKLVIPEPTACEARALEKAGPSYGPAEPGTYAYFVIAGLGFDASIMGDANSALKSRIGWLAYVTAALGHLKDTKMTAKLTTGGEDGRVYRLEARSIMFANCGELIAGLLMAPNAHPDDGWLDVCLLDTKVGLIGWGDLARRVLLHGFDIRDDALPQLGKLDFHRTRSATAEVRHPELVQVDGDVLGYALRVSTTIDHHALRIRA